MSGKKSLRRIAEVVLDQPAHQSLQQFINQSPWSWEPVRKALAEYVGCAARPRAWVVERVVIPKRGDRSIGVDRRFVKQQGRTISCQVGIAAFLAGDTLDLPVNWRILLPPRWDTDGGLRSSSYVPAEVMSRPEWQEISTVVGEMASDWTLPPAPVLVDMRDTRNAGQLAAELGRLGLEFVIEVDGSFQVIGGAHLAAVGRDGPGRQRDDGRLVHAREFLFGRDPWYAKLAAAAGHPTKTDRPVHVTSALVRMPGEHGRSGRPQALRLLGQWSPARRHGDRIWITNIMHVRLDEIMSLARSQHRVAAGLPQFQEQFGLQDFEGRSFRGWHHHMTMVSAAYAYWRLHEDRSGQRLEPCR